MTDAALYFTAPETVEVRETTVGPPDDDELLVDAKPTPGGRLAVRGVAKATQLRYHPASPGSSDT